MPKNKQPLQLEISRSIFNDAFYPMLVDYSHRWEVYKRQCLSGLGQITFHITETSAEGTE